LKRGTLGSAKERRNGKLFPSLEWEKVRKTNK